MKNTKLYLGIDIGTSSAKGILRSTDGGSFNFKQTYRSNDPNGWTEAIKALIADIRATAKREICAIGFSSQVGTYIVNGKDIIPWHSGVGREELNTLKSVISQEEFEREISMRHPELVSYPLPRLMHIQRLYGKDCEILMPKELLIRDLTGNAVTDVFSMRGIANLENGNYAKDLINKAEIKQKLPPIKRPTDLAGYVTEEAAKKYGLKPNTPVYIGCNDFFAGLLGMGIYNVGDAFDLSGTSEHVGYIGEDINRYGFVSGKYFIGNCTYGGTKSSGLCCDLAIKNFGIDGIDIDDVLSKAPPIFLPYLNGERAPIFDDEARGVYFGLSNDTDKKALAYSTLEGVVFSLYDIASSMNMPTPKRLICSGGSARDMLMNKLRATLFDCEVIGVCENDSSALGACMLAMVGDGAYKDIREAIEDNVKYTGAIMPEKKYAEILKKRFVIYKEIYGDLRSTFKKFNEIQERIK